MLFNGGLQSVLFLIVIIANGNIGTSSLLSNPIVSNIISNFINKLTHNHNIANDQAGCIT